MKKIFKTSVWMMLGMVITIPAMTQNIDLKHQQIEISFDWENKRINGSTELFFSINKTTEVIELDASQIDLIDVQSQEGTSLSFHQIEDKLTISLDKTYSRGSETTITMRYQTKGHNDTDPANPWGSLGEGVRFFEPSSTEPGRQRQIWSVGEPNGNALWFPGVHSRSDLRTTELIVKVDKPLRVISNGKLKDTRDNGDGTRTFFWQTDLPHAAHLTSFVVGRYLDVTQSYGNVEIHSFCYPHEADATAATVERLPDMMKYYSEVTGVEYPFPSYTQTFVQEFAGGASSMMTATITENMVDDYVTHKDFLYLWDNVESEALAGQWFGAHIVPDNWQHAWLSRAFARYLSGLYNEYKNGVEEYLSYQYSPQINTYMTDWRNGKIQPVVNPNFKEETSFVRSNHPYLHGASVLHMLRKQLGNRAWFQLLKEYTRAYAGQLVTTNDFKRMAEQVSGQGLGWFFNQWVYGVGHPVFEVTKGWETDSRQLTLKVKQVQKLDTLETEHPITKYFQGKLSIEIDQNIHSVELKPQAENTFRFELDQTPRFVNFDFQGGWVKELRFEQSNEEWIAQLHHSKDILGRIAALNQLTSIASLANTSLSVQQKIHAAIRSVILSDQTYWRLKMLGLWGLQGLLVKANGKLTLDATTETMLMEVIKKEESWVKSSAIWFLGMSGDPKYASLYIDAFEDWSDRVTNAAAIALGKTKDQRAFDALVELQYKPSWKNQSLISALNGLQWLGDKRGADLAIRSLANNEAKHWTLFTPIWDHRQAAALTLAALGKGEEGFEYINEQLDLALEEDELNDALYNALQLVNLGDPRGRKAFDMLKSRYASNDAVLQAVKNYEQQLEQKLK